MSRNDNAFKDEGWVSQRCSQVGPMQMQWRLSREGPFHWRFLASVSRDLYCVSIVFLLIYVLSCSFQCIVFLLVFVGPTAASTLRTGYHIVVTLVGAWLHFNPGAQPSSAASCPLRLLPFSLMLQWTSEDQPLMEEIQNTGYPIWVVWRFNHQLMLRRSWSENFA